MAPTVADTPTPYATLLGFTRYVDRTGPAKATFVGGLRRQRASRSGFNPHGQLVKALKTDIAFHTGGTHLSAVVDLVKPRWKPLYEALVPGALAWLRSLDDPDTVQLAQTHDALGMLGGLPVKINPHLGLRHPDGRAEAVRLHLDEQPPSNEAVIATLHLMDRHMGQVLPHAEPVLVDVRRGVSHKRDASVKTEQVERWLAGEAAAFAAIWTTAA
ncbi:hypothetical protein [Polymorphospora rubra]|uniref:Uncharacterized protein n=1 Tax=Polymorphospora rubra TaxID=338584 RepID=A0A810N2L9_9ACTN|nr:hypothetical protein [Polymorphospora rubra]BCJ67702.1 hypothetical protein Prubr_47230 [Polymorphospora rubra]